MPAQIGQGRGAPRQPWILFALVPQDGLQIGRGVCERRGIEQLGGSQHVHAHGQPLQPGPGIRQRTESQIAARAQPGRRLGDGGKCTVERHAILRERQRFDRAPSGRTSGVPQQDFPQASEFENVFCRA